jgi:hypothetical protein
MRCLIAVAAAPTAAGLAPSNTTVKEEKELLARLTGRLLSTALRASLVVLTLPLLLSLLLLLLLVTDASSVSARVLLILPETSKLLVLLLLLLLLFPLLSSPTLMPTAALDEFGCPGVGRDHTDAVSPMEANTSNQSSSSVL